MGKIAERFRGDIKLAVEGLFDGNETSEAGEVDYRRQLEVLLRDGYIANVEIDIHINTWFEPFYEWLPQDKHEDLYYRVDKVEIFGAEGDVADSIDEYAWIEGELKL